jgi:hypothetical protein
MTTTTDLTLTGNTDPTLTDATSSSSPTTAPVLALDQADTDYSPGETVGITASNVAVGGSCRRRRCPDRVGRYPGASGI